MENRVSDEIYNKIFNNISEIPNLNKISFDMMVDLVTELIGNISISRELDINNKRDTLIYAFYEYLFKILNTFLLFASGSHRVGALILSRTIIEIYIKFLYLLERDEEELYCNYIKTSLVAEKFYLKELEGFQSFEEEFIKGTKDSIYQLLNDSGIDDIQNISRKNSSFPKIEDMASYLIDKGLVSSAIYNITYRTSSNYTHANWSALEMEAFRDTSQKVDIRLIAPIAVLIIDLVLFVNKKINNLKEDFVFKLKIYKSSFICLDKENINRKYNKK